MLPKNHNIKLDKKKENIQSITKYSVYLLFAIEFYLNIHDPGNGFSIGGI